VIERRVSLLPEKKLGDAVDLIVVTAIGKRQQLVKELSVP
jgi:hypothetical protein